MKTLHYGNIAAVAKKVKLTVAMITLAFFLPCAMRSSGLGSNWIATTGGPHLVDLIKYEVRMLEAHKLCTLRICLQYVQHYESQVTMARRC